MENAVLVFKNINPKDIADAIISANLKVIYVSPGLDKVIARALIEKAAEIGQDNVTVLLDVAENVLRYGYGTIEGINMLKNNNISIKEATGVRIGALIHDNNGLIFSPIPLLIEAGRKELSQPNAMVATAEQVENIVDAITPTGTYEQDKNTVDTVTLPGISEQNENTVDTTALPDISENQKKPEIGTTKVSLSKIEDLQQAINENPPQKFDIARKVQVFSTAIEFVEIKLKGYEIQRRTVSIPTDLLVGKVDLETKRQLKAGFNIIEKGSTLSGDPIRNEVNELKRTFTKHIPKYGNVLLKSKKKQFNEAVSKLKKSINKFQEDVEKKLEEEIEKARDRLINMLIPAVTKNPTDDLLMQIQGDKATEDQVKQYLTIRLKSIFPSAKDVTTAISLDCIIKAITYETISNEEFQDHIKNAYPLINWDEMFEEYDAARESQ